MVDQPLEDGGGAQGADVHSGRVRNLGGGEFLAADLLHQPDIAVGAAAQQADLAPLVKDPVVLLIENERGGGEKGQAFLQTGDQAAPQVLGTLLAVLVPGVGRPW